MSRILVTAEALRELRLRTTRFGPPEGVVIMGPSPDSTWPSDSLEEAWSLERLYGPFQRWQFVFMPLDALRDTSFSRYRGYAEEVDGIYFEVLSPPPVPRLRVELHGDAIRIYEFDA